MISRYKAIVFAAALAAATPAAAEGPVIKPMNYNLKYDVTWNGLPIGRIRIDTTETEFRYSATVDTKTRGIVRLFDSTKSTIRVNGKVNDGKRVAREYSSISRDDDDSKITTIRYGMDGKILERKRTPADNPKSRPPVSEEQANEGMDPITAMLTIRHILRDNILRNERNSTVRTYDGARLADFTLNVVSRAQLSIMDKSVNAMNMVLKRKPIAGYKEKELKKFREGDPTIHVYFSADDKFIPLQADIDLRFGDISAKLVSMVEKK